MTATDLHEALDSLARLADHDPAPDRLAGITRKRREQRNRRGAVGAGVAALAVIATSIGVAAVPRGGDADGGVATTAPTPSPSPQQTLSVRMRVDPTGEDTYRVSYTLDGTSLSVRDAETGDPIEQGGPLRTRVLLDGKEIRGTDGGSVECDPGGKPEAYDTVFPPAEVTIKPGDHTVTVEVDYCGPDGSRMTARDSQKAYYMGVASVADRARKDLDGDGTIERLTLVDEGTSTALKVSGSVNGTVSVEGADPVFISGASDLDGNGVKEMSVDVEDGILTHTFLVTAVNGAPQVIRPESGSPSLLNGRGDGRFWGSGVFDDVLTSWVGEDDPAYDPGSEEGMPLTIPLDGGTWTLDGTTLRFTPWATPHCGAPNGGAVEC
jgi:hypothetical protein